MLHAARWQRSRILALLVAGLVLSAPLLAGAQEADLDQARQQVQADQAAVAAQIDATRASDDEVSTALAAVGDELEHQNRRVEDTQRAVAGAEQSLAAAREQVTEARSAVEQAAGQLRQAAVDGYVRPADAERLERVFTSEPGQGAVRDALARSAVRSTSDALDLMRAAQEDLSRAEAEAAAAETEARGQHAEAEMRLAEIDVAYAQHANLVTDIEARLDRLLGEAVGLASRDAALAAQITERQAALAAQVAAAAQAAEDAAAHDAAHGEAGGTGGEPTPGEMPAVAASRSSGNIALATVRGIEVAAEIGSQLAAMLAAADADGIYLEGGGWRSSDEQIAIRMEVCGTSEYAIWEMPSWECSPPVARPGRSMHEQGLAIDFTADGDLIRSQSHPAFNWLASNAERFGFYNLPSEPWHWSTTGS